MKVLFAGTPETAVPSLRSVAARHDVLAVVTRPDAPVGRRRTLTPSPVARAASELGLYTLKASRLDSDTVAALSDTDVDVGVVVAYGALIREPLLSHPHRGWINVHFSLLPRWRGAAPVQRAIMAGDETTGVSVMALDATLDTGAVYAQRTTPILTKTAGTLLDEMSEAGAAALNDVLAALPADAAPQVGAATYAEKLVREDGRITWHEPREAVLRHIQGVTPKPGAFTTVGDRSLKIHAFDAGAEPPGAALALAPGQVLTTADRLWVGTADSPIALTEVQPEGKRAMSAAAWCRGLRSVPRLGES